MVIIGPGTGYQGQWLLWEPDGAGGGARAQIRRTRESRQRRAAPYCHHTRCGEINLTAEPLADDRRCGMNSLLVPEPTHPERYGKFNARRSYAIKSRQSRALIHRCAGAPIAAPGDLRYKLEIARNGTAGTNSLD